MISTCQTHLHRFFSWASYELVSVTKRIIIPNSLKFSSDLEGKQRLSPPRKSRAVEIIIFLVTDSNSYEAHEKFEIVTWRCMIVKCGRLAVFLTPERTRYKSTRGQRLIRIDFWKRSRFNGIYIAVLKPLWKWKMRRNQCQTPVHRLEFAIYFSLFAFLCGYFVRKQPKTYCSVLRMVVKWHLSVSTFSIRKVNQWRFVLACIL